MISLKLVIVMIVSYHNNKKSGFGLLLLLLPKRINKNSTKIHTRNDTKMVKIKKIEFSI